MAGTDRVDPTAALHELAGRYGVRAVRVDAGGTLNGHLLRAGLVEPHAVRPTGRCARSRPTISSPSTSPESQLPEPSCEEVMGPNERAQARATVIAMNAKIADAIADVEARRGVEIAPVDIFSLVDQMAGGVDVDGDGASDLTTGYLGGIFGLDGIHPTRTGNALLANAFIDAINRRFGEAVPPVDVARVALHDPLVNNQYRPVGEPPFGLIGDGRH